MLFVAGIDALGAVAGEEILIEFQPRLPFQDRDAILFGAAGVDCGFVNNDIAFVQGFAHGVAGADQGAQIRSLVLIDGGGDGNDIDVAGFQCHRVGGNAEMV